MVNRSLWVALYLTAACSVPPATFTPLVEGTVTVARTGNGTVTSSPAGIDCGPACSHAFEEGTQVSLTATPAANAAFAGWSGACAGMDACVLDVGSEGIAVQAMFSSVTLEIALAGDAPGRVRSEPAGIDCGATCAAEFAPGAVVTLIAEPGQAPASFAGWSGTVCPDTGPCALMLTEAMTSLTARFTKRGSRAFTASGNFMVPPGVASIRVVAVGGGGGGANGHQGGGGSGLVAAGDFAVNAGEVYAVTVGAAGLGAVLCNGCNDIAGNTPGGASSFGALLTAAGGRTPTVINSFGGNGGGGGGGACNAGFVGGAGGKGGTSGGACTGAGGTGQSGFEALLATVDLHALTAAPGGAGGMSSHAGGGGGGGVLLDGAGPAGANGAAMFSAKGGGGYGGGGGGGGFDAQSGPVREAGGNGAAGLVYIEW